MSSLRLTTPEPKLSETLETKESTSCVANDLECGTGSHGVATEEDVPEPSVDTVGGDVRSVPNVTESGTSIIFCDIDGKTYSISEAVLERT